MAKKFKLTFSFKKLANKLEKIIIDDINAVGNRLNKAIQDGIDKGRDINNIPFKSLAPITGSMRIAKQGYYKRSGGGGILNYTGNMRKTKKIPATKARKQFIIEMIGKNKKGKFYGAFHNTGFEQENKKQWFYGSRTPKREWFGIPKSMFPGESEYKKAIALRSIKIKAAWKK